MIIHRRGRIGRLALLVALTGLTGSAVAEPPTSAPATRPAAAETAPTPPGASTTAAVWPRSRRGPARDGQCAGPAWPDRLSTERVQARWRVDDLGPSYAGPVVGANRVFTVGTHDAKREVVIACDRDSGRELWRTAWDGAMEVPFFAKRNGSWVRSTPAFDGERLYVAGMRDVLTCLDAATGDVQWTCDFTDRFASPMPAFGFVCSPLVTDAHVYAQAGGGVVKLDKRTGATVWRSIEDGGGMNSAFSSPVLTTLAGVPQLVVQTRNELCGLAPDTGAVLWQRPVKSFRGMNIVTPLPYGDAVFTAPYGGRAQILDVGRTDAAFQVSQRWSQAVQGNMTSPVVVDGHAYFLTRSNRFVCLDLADGTERWTSGPTGDDYCSLIAQGDRILALADTGVLRLLRATPEAYTVIDEMSLGDGPMSAHLAVAGDEIYVREQNALVAYRWR